LTVLYEILGDRSTALRTLGLALDAGYEKGGIANDPELANLRQDRRYQMMISEI
jgi:hypothetical protein